MLIRRVLALLGFALLLTAVARRRLTHRAQGRRDSQSSAAQNYSAHAYQKQPVRPFAPALDSSDQAEEREHRRAERRHWKWNVVTGAASATAAIGAAFFAWSALNASWQQAEAARRSLINADRPWIRVMGLSDVTLDINPAQDTVYGSVRVIIKNIGRSPSEYTTVRIKLRTNHSFLDQSRDAAALCDEVVRAGQNPLYDLVFPDEVHHVLGVDALRMKEIREEREGDIRREYEITRRTSDEGVARRQKEAAETAPLRSGFSIVGCVTYAIPVGQVMGQTAFIYSIDHVCSESAFRHCTFDLTVPAIYEDRDVIIRGPVGGTFAH